MATINIRRDVKDSFYRYKMPRLISKIEGKGNGIKTVIPNMADIARSLSRPPSYPTKFFGCELGAQVKFEAANDRYIVNGAHDAAKLQSLLDVFIDKFVLCPACKNPETDLIITRDHDIIRDCKACGKRNGVDLRHKLSTFILKHPPANQSGKKGGKKDKASRKQGGANAATAANGGENSVEAASGSDDELTRRIVSEAADLPSAHQYEDDDDWAVDDMSEAAIRARQEKLTGHLQNKLVLENEDDDGGDDLAGVASKYDEFGDYLTEHPNSSVDEIIAEAKALQVWGKHRAIEVVVQALFTTDVVKQLAKYQKLLVGFGRTEKHQRSILGGLERLIGVKYPEQLLSKTPSIFLAVYNLDLVEEEVFAKWAEKVSKKYVDKETSKKIHAKAEPFIQWLQEAEEESDSEEEDE
ncbi:eukaryotic translation initiation factor 5 [Dispira parvispora]|uniref:Eukaryotic translation initiation factor 5 n=1 Tax=Dispira parvispora TaxID=1520584 RepID=A0A9W8E3G4_9FUNG|nr:eukaryotic translation initiation factor 5 [Dispira parvispora]